MHLQSSLITLVTQFSGFARVVCPNWRPVDYLKRRNMASTGGRIATDSDLLRYAEYTPRPKQRSETDIDKRVVSKLYCVAFKTCIHK